MKPDISEFSYGFALTDELIHWHGSSITAAPVFPSLYEEGQAGGGYDVMLRRPGLPLFLQFKLSDCMVRSSAKEVKDGLFTVPFYRMPIRPSRLSKQHEMLLELESKGNEVYYSAPAFHTPEELNDAYFNYNVKERSLWLRPSRIGSLQDERDHHVAFTLPGTPQFCSKPQPLDAKGDFDEFSQDIMAAFKQKAEIALKKDWLEEMAMNVRKIAEKRVGVSLEKKFVAEELINKKHLLAVIAFYASTFMDCQLFLISEKQQT